MHGLTDPAAADTAQAARRMVKGRRQNVVDVTLEGDGKLGLVFIKDSQPPEIKDIKEDGLAAKARPPLRPRSYARRFPLLTTGVWHCQATPKLTVGMTLLKVGETSVEDLDYGARCAATRPSCVAFASYKRDISLDSDCGFCALVRPAAIAAAACLADVVLAFFKLRRLA